MLISLRGCRSVWTYIQDVSDQVVELETSDELGEKINKNVKLLQTRYKTAIGALESVERKLLED